MPELKCTVQTCMHNQDFLCRLDSIQVGGSQAKASKETCCDSFEERKTQGMENSYTNAYGNHATAPSDRCACHKDGTECATFQCR